jgi:acyl-coenzyme A synthetase/AMP-(fatty) acid ligase
VNAVKGDGWSVSIPPLTSEYIEVHAAHRPTQVAVMFHGQSWDYARFDQDIKRFTLALREFGLAPGSRVAVATRKMYLHWVLLLACENLGLVTWSFLHGEEAEVLRIQLPVADLVISEDPVPSGAARRLQMITESWLEETGRRDPALYAAAGLPLKVAMESPWRIRRSSGTTGQQKMIEASRRVEETWLHGFAGCIDFTQHSRYVARRHFTVGSIYSCSTVCVRLGATVILDTTSDTLEVFERFKPTHMRMFQPELIRLLDEMPVDWQKPLDFTLLVGAAPLSARAWQRTNERLTDRIVYNYNSNECGSICLMRPDGIGTVRPGVEVRIIDEAGRVLGAGETGQITVRSASAASAYLRDDEATRRTFRDGWVHTGDLGTVVGPRQIRIVGRVDDLLNVGGLKLMPAELEDPIRAGAPVADVGVCVIADENGLGRLHIALVRKPEASPEAAVEFVRQTVPSAFGRMHVIFFPRLPRTETGKLRRAEMRSEIVRFLETKRS